MRFPAQTVPWLLAHELRLTWRRFLTQRGAAWRAPLLIGLFALAALVVGGPIGVMLRSAALTVTPTTIFAGDAAVLVFFVWMLSQSLAASIEAFFMRGDLDLIFSSPVDPRKVLVVRCLAIAANVFAGFAIFVTPIMIPVALIGHPAWLAIYPLLAATALSATALGLILASLLFRVLGPRRARATAQILAVALGSLFFIAGQLPNLLGLTKLKAWIVAPPGAAEAAHLSGTLLAWPIRGFTGDLGSLASLLILGGVVFAAATLFIGRRFASDSAAAAGLDAAPARRAGPGAASFTAGVAAVTILKELRLLVRDITLMAAVLFRLVYLLPVALVLVRNAGRHAALLLPVGVGAVTFMVGQTVLTLAMIMIAGEEAPDLLASSPASAQRLRRAKMAAAILPVAVVMAAPVIVLVALAPLAGAAAIAGTGFNAVANVLITARLQKPAPRATFRRRGGGASLTAGMVSLFIGALISAAAGMAATATLFALIPLILATAGLAVVNEIKPVGDLDALAPIPRRTLRMAPSNPTSTSA